MRPRECVGSGSGAAASRLAAGALALSAILLACTSARAQTAVPLIEPKPVFTPRRYETESRNSALQDQPVKSRTCIASRDYDAFRDDTMAQYQKSPQFVKDCRLSDTRTIKNGPSQIRR